MLFVILHITSSPEQVLIKKGGEKTQEKNYQQNCSFQIQNVLFFSNLQDQKQTMRKGCASFTE